MADIGPNPPHGPDMTGNNPPYEEMHVHERAAFDKLIRPDDSYTPEGEYWADLPLGKKISFVTSVDAKEARHELGAIRSMIKADPLSPVSYYFKNMVLPGAGLGLEGYVLFSIGNVTPLLQGAFPDCWKKHTICNANWIAAIGYLEVAGIIVGQILVGFLGDWIGRRWGLIQDATIMFLGLVMLTAAWGTTQNGWIICYAWSLFIYGIGVGGEYPMTATSGMENAVGSGKISTRDDRLHRGRKVTSAFLMQGWGQLLNQGLLIILLLCFHHGSGLPPYSEVAAQWTYRVSFGIPAIGTLWLVYYRAYHMKAASKQLEAAKKKASVTGYDNESLRLCFKHFGMRIVATAGGWFANDVFFYGNKLFQSRFITVILPNEKDNIMPNWLYNLLNVGVSLVGYYLASFLIDNKLYGRKKMQIVGFLLDFILFVIPAFKYDYFTSPEHIHSFQAMYFLSSFFNQFGPNAVTFIVAAEVYPAPIRATAHGISAAWGKLGALMAAIIGAYISIQNIFYYVPWVGLLGAFLTFFFLPDTTGLDLKEQERRWHYIRQGRESEYHGPAVHPKHLSLWERWRGAGKYYNAELDYQQKVEEYRAQWEDGMARKGDEDFVSTDDTDDSLFEGHVHRYFERTKPEPPPKTSQKLGNDRHSGSKPDTKTVLRAAYATRLTATTEFKTAKLQRTHSSKFSKPNPPHLPKSILKTPARRSYSSNHNSTPNNTSTYVSFPPYVSTSTMSSYGSQHAFPQSPFSPYNQPNSPYFQPTTQQPPPPAPPGAMAIPQPQRQYSQPHNSYGSQTYPAQPQYAYSASPQMQQSYLQPSDAHNISMAVQPAYVQSHSYQQQPRYDRRSSHASHHSHRSGRSRHSRDRSRSRSRSRSLSRDSSDERRYERAQRDREHRPSMGEAIFRTFKYIGGLLDPKR